MNCAFLASFFVINLENVFFLDYYFVGRYRRIIFSDLHLLHSGLQKHLQETPYLGTLLIDHILLGVSCLKYCLFLLFFFSLANIL